MMVRCLGPGGLIWGIPVNTDYWLGQIQEPVGFSGRAGTLARLGVDVVVEVGTDFMMARTFGDAWPDSAGAPVVLPTLVSGDGESPESDDGFVRAVAGAYETGLDVSFEGLFAGEARRRIALQTYPFQRRRHWILPPRQRPEGVRVESGHRQHDQVAEGRERS